MRLFLVEVRRLFARRFFTMSLLLMFLGLIAVLGIVAYRGEPLNFRASITEYLTVMTIVAALFGYLIGATFIGAEWHYSTMTGLLLTEPRRFRVYLAKLFALLFGVGAGTVAFYAIGVGGVAALAATRGSTDGISNDFISSLGLYAVRGLAVVLFGAAVAFTIAFTLRRTSAALGAAVAYFAIAEIGLRLVSDSAVQWLLMTRLEAWMRNGTTVTVGCGESGGCQELYINIWQGGAMLGILVLVLLIVSAVVFRRREVA